MRVLTYVLCGQHRNCRQLLTASSIVRGDLKINTPHQSGTGVEASETEGRGLGGASVRREVRDAARILSPPSETTARLMDPRGGRAVSPPASRQGEPGSIPGRVTPDFRIWKSYRTMALVGGFSQGSHVSPVISFLRCSILTSITLIGSQTTRLPPRRTEHDSGRGISRIFARVNRAGRSRRSAGFLGDLTSTPPLHSGAALYSPRFTHIGSRGFDVKSRPRISTHSTSLYLDLKTEKEGSRERERERGRENSRVLFEETIQPEPPTYRDEIPLRLLLHKVVHGAAVVERLDCSSPNEANQAQSPAEPLSELRKWESYRMMPLVGGFSLGSSFYPALAFWRCSIPT
ncbi:hypothetical protein PR048_025467 [Dryococelus australis]|uniref:Uncharacterized protein n=1 Tax=Dryococelus australis TaxID=614101 RepID=A0ABQ9GRE6_9NEOP|nr:hypothetical protein PR048_025467 [Dryococelus australis]